MRPLATADHAVSGILVPAKFAPARDSRARLMTSRAQLVAGRLLRVHGAPRPAPSLFTYPGLTSKPWHERDSRWFRDWLPALEEQTPAILEEYLQVRESGRASDYRVAASDHQDGLHSAPDEWHWATLIDRGHVQPEMWEQCPRTASALEAVPRLCVGDMPFSFAFFSTLKAGSRIAPHTAPANLRLRLHLPLIVPPESAGACGIRVGDEARRWEVGKALLFDDAFVHSVWNETAEERVVLLADIWHPDLSADEIQAVQAMFREVEAMSAARKAKEPA